MNQYFKIQKYELKKLSEFKRVNHEKINKIIKGIDLTA